MKKKKIAAAIYVLYAIIYIYIIYVFVAPWYITVEARYARDNLNYLSTQLYEKGILASPIKTDGDDFFHWPYDKSMEKIYELSTEWCSAYMAHLQDKGVYKETVYNPYETLSKLKYDSVIPEVNTVYRTIMMEMAITKTDTDYSNGLIDTWEHEQEENQEQAKAAFKTMEEQKVLCRFILVISSIPMVIISAVFLFWDFIFHEKNHNISVKNNIGKIGGNKRNEEEGNRDHHKEG